MAYDPKVFGEWLREQRGSRSQSAMGDSVGRSQTWVSRLESGDGNAQIELRQVEPLARFLGVHPQAVTHAAGITPMVGGVRAAVLAAVELDETHRTVLNEIYDTFAARSNR